MNIKAAIWDLDGTLLNTLDDLAASTNAALAENGLPTHTVDEVRMFVGNGIGKLIERAVPDGQDNPQVSSGLRRVCCALRRAQPRPHKAI